MNNSWSLQGKRAVITGASRGIGKAIAREFAARGSAVHLIARSGEQLKQIVRSLHEEGSEAEYTVCDLSDADARQDLIKAISRSPGRLDILVNNAGINIRKKTLEATTRDLKKILEINTEAAYDLSKQSFPFLKEGGGGTIINISSIASRRIVRTSTAIYAMSKGAMDQMTRFFAAEWARDGIRAFTLHPWYIETSLVKTVLEDKGKKEAILDRTPMNRLGQPEDVARVAAFLAMPAAGYMTGNSIEVDGGFSLLGH